MMQQLLQFNVEQCLQDVKLNNEILWKSLILSLGHTTKYNSLRVMWTLNQHVTIIHC